MGKTKRALEESEPEKFHDYTITWKAQKLTDKMFRIHQKSVA
jgi:hypothetical protein